MRAGILVPCPWPQGIISVNVPELRKHGPYLQVCMKYIEGAALAPPFLALHSALLLSRVRPGVMVRTHGSGVFPQPADGKVGN
jgi:hypothetical protein